MKGCRLFASNMQDRETRTPVGLAACWMLGRVPSRLGVGRSSTESTMNPPITSLVALATTRRTRGFVSLSPDAERIVARRNGSSTRYSRYCCWWWRPRARCLKGQLSGSWTKNSTRLPTVREMLGRRKLLRAGDLGWLHLSEQACGSSPSPHLGPRHRPHASVPREGLHAPRRRHMRAYLPRNPCARE